MFLFLDETCSWAEKLFTNIDLPPLMMPDKDSKFTFGGFSLNLDFRKWWRHLQPKNTWATVTKSRNEWADRVTQSNGLVADETNTSGN